MSDDKPTLLECAEDHALPLLILALHESEKQSADPWQREFAQRLRRAIKMHQNAIIKAHDEANDDCFRLMDPAI